MRGPAAPARRVEPLEDGDPVRAARLAAGVLGVGPKAPRTGGLSPFALRGLAPALADDLHAMGWLDDAAAADRADRAVLRAWAFDWIARFGAGAGPGWAPDVAGRRLGALAAAWPWLAAGADAADRRRLGRAVAVHLRFLARRWDAAPAGIARLTAAAGWALGTAAAGDAAAAARAGAALGAAAEATFDGDGGVADRAPATLAGAVARLAWAADALAAAGVAADPRATLALGRAAPALRALRLGDGAPPAVHAQAVVPGGVIDVALARAGPAGRGMRRQGALGQARLAAGATVVLMDAAPPPPGPWACAATLALEVGVGRARLFGGIGPGAAFGADWALAARATAAQSAVEVAGASSARLAPADWAGRRLGRPFAAGPGCVTLERARDLDALWLRAEHDGYLRRHGALVGRRLRLSADGRDLRGEDTLSAPDPAARAAWDRAGGRDGLAWCVRFHLGGEVVAEPDGDGVRLRLPDGAVWRATASGGTLTLGDSVSLHGGAPPPVPARQIAIAARALGGWGRIAWAFAEIAPPARAARARAQTAAPA